MESRALLTTFDVTSLADSGPGSLREAIEGANANPGADRIEFSVAAENQAYEILLQSALPDITESVEIDGWSAPGFVDRPIIVLNGFAAVGLTSGFVVESDNVLIRGLVIQDFSLNGIHLGAASATTLQGNFIGTDSTGSQQAGNGMHGIFVSTESEGNTIGSDADGLNDEREGNVISGNQADGIHVHASDGSVIFGNLIGVSADGNDGLGNSGNGIQFLESQMNFVGGTAEHSGNVIGDNGANGIFINDSVEQVIKNNQIGISADGESLGNNLDGIRLVAGQLPGNPPAIVYAIDVSGSTGARFEGTNVGDVNNDGSVNTILDAELAGFIEFTQTLIDLGYGADIEVGVSVFATDSAKLDVNWASGNQYTTLIGHDTDGDGQPDLIDHLKRIRVGHENTGVGTSFARGLDAVIETIQGSNTPSEDYNLIFVSDGVDGSEFTSQLATLDQLNVNRTAIGMGEQSSLADLQLIDPDAQRVTSSSEFSNLLLGLLGTTNSDGQYGTRATIGGLLENEANVIAYNSRDGVNVANVLTFRNSIRANSIFGNGGLGIDLGRNDHEPNDSLDADIGANYLMNYPVLTSVDYNATDDLFQVVGELDSAPDSEFSIDLYANQSADNDGYTQGEIYLGTFSVSTGAGGLAQIDERFAGLSEGRWFLNATATDSDGNTSEFSQAIELIIPPAVFVVQDGQASESDEEITFTVLLDRPLDIDVVVDVTPSGLTARPGTDFDDTPLSVLYEAGEFGNRNVTFPVTQDNIAESTETFQVLLSSETEFEAASAPDLTSTAIGTITDDDTSVLEVSDITVNEDELSIDLEIQYTNPMNIPLEVDFEYRDITTLGDYDTTPVTVTFLSGVAETKTVSIGLVRDDVVESTEQFEVHLTTETHFGQRSVDLSDFSLVTIVDNDTTEISVDDGAPGESDDLFTGTVSLENPVDIDTEYQVQIVDLETTGDSDYSTAIENVTIPAGETSAAFTISILDDDLVEQQERIQLSLVPVTEFGDRSVTFGSGNVTIVDDDSAVFTIDDVTVNEADGSFDFSVALDGLIDTEVELEISFRVDEEQIAPGAEYEADYFATANPISFFWPEATVGSNTFTVQLVDDELAEGLEEFSIVLNTITNLQTHDVFLGDRGKVQIEDDDLRLVVTETDGFTQVTEDGGEDTFFVALGGRPMSTVFVDMSNTNSGEVRVLTQRLVFAPDNWNVPQPVVVQGQQDEIPDGIGEGDIVLTINESLSDELFFALEPVTVPVTNLDDDLPEWDVIETGVSTVVHENGSTDSVFLQLSRAPDSMAVFEVTAADESRIAVEPQQLVFTPEDWDEPRRIVFVGVDNQQNSGEGSTDIVVTPATGSDQMFLEMPELRIPVEIRAERTFTMDVDGDGTAQALTDGILILRYMAGFRGDALIASAVNPSGTRTTAAEIEPWLEDRLEFLDVDADGQNQPLTDGILWIRFTAGFSGDSLVANAVGSGVRTTAGDVSTYMQPFIESPPLALAGGLPEMITATQKGETGETLSLHFHGVERAEDSLDLFFAEQFYGTAS